MYSSFFLFIRLFASLPRVFSEGGVKNMLYSLSSNFDYEEYFLQVYERNVNRVYSIAILFLKNRHDAEDVVQTVFLRFYNSLKAFNDLEHEKAWFIFSAKNASKDILKSFWRSKIVDIENIVDNSYLDRDDNINLFESLLALPNKYKVILYLYYYEGFSVNEISALIGRNQSTIRTQLSKGRKLLKLDMGGYYED